MLLVLGLLLLELGLLTFEGGDQFGFALFGRLDYFAGKLAQIIVQRLCLFAAKKAHVVGVRGGPLWHARGARPYGAASERARVEVRVRELAKEFVPVDDRPFTHHNFGYHGILREVRFYFEPRSSISVC